MNISGSAVRSYVSAGVSSQAPSGVCSPASFNTPPVHEQSGVIEGEVLNKSRAQGASYHTAPIASDYKINSYLQCTHSNTRDMSIGYYIDYFA